jgi:hypothetical protein
MIRPFLFLLAILTAALTVSAADQSVTVTPSATSFGTGSTGTFTTIVRSTGPDAAASAVNIQFTALSGNIDAMNITVVSKPAEFTCGAQFETAQGHNIPCTAASIPAGYEGSIVLSATITGTSGNMNVRSSVTTPADPDTANNQATAGITVTQPQADLALTITSPTPSAVPSGSTATYIVDFENDGPDAAANAVVSFRFTSLNGTIGVTNIQVVSTPAGFSCGAPVATAQGPTVSCTTSSFASGATGSITFTGEVTGSSGQMEVCANISSPTTSDPDTNGQLNSGCVLNTVTAAEPDPTTSIACPGAFVAGNSGQGTVTISAAQGSNTTIALASSNPAVATVPATVVILAGQTSAPFTVTGVGPGTSTITATPPAGFGTAQTCDVTVNAAAASPQISLGNGNCPAAPIGPGTNAMATVSISPAQGTNTVIALQSSNPSVATVPPTVTILAGQTSATFVISGVSSGSTTITATLPDALGGDTATCTTVVIARSGEVESVPTLSPAVLAVLALLLAGVALFVTRS